MNEDQVASMHNSMTKVWSLAEWAPRLIWSGVDSKRHLQIGAMPAIGQITAALHTGRRADSSLRSVPSASTERLRAGQSSQEPELRRRHDFAVSDDLRSIEPRWRAR
jgi:hypothetical protein